MESVAKMLGFREPEVPVYVWYMKAGSAETQYLQSIKRLVTTPSNLPEC